jgi:hypothetical protein
MSQSKTPAPLQNSYAAKEKKQTLTYAAPWAEGETLTITDGLVTRQSDGFYAICSTLDGEWILRDWIERPETNQSHVCLVEAHLGDLVLQDGPAI